MNSQLEIKLATKMTDTPETDAMEYYDAMCDPDRVVEADFARKLERERDVAQKAMGDARDILLDAMPDANASTKILAEMIVAERDMYEQQITHLLERLGKTQERMIDAERICNKIYIARNITHSEESMLSAIAEIDKIYRTKNDGN